MDISAPLEFISFIRSVISYLYHLRTSPVRRFFGKSIRETILVCVPIYDPLCPNDSEPSAGNQTEVLKSAPTTTGSLNTFKTTLHCSVIAESDYRAAEALKKLFWNAGLSSGEIIGDNKAFSLDEDGSRVYVGAPTINMSLKGRFATNFDNVLKIYKGKLGNLPRVDFIGKNAPAITVSQDNLLGVVARWQQGGGSKDYEVCVFGCRGESTLATVHWLCRNNGLIIKKFCKTMNKKQNRGDKKMLAVFAFPSTDTNTSPPEAYIHTAGGGWSKFTG